MTVDVQSSNMDEVDEGVIKLIGEVQLRKFGKFLEEYGSYKLKAVEQALDESLSDVWNAEFDPISLKLCPHECYASVLDLISTDNKVLNKVISVLAVLCLEIDNLNSEAKKVFFPALLFYGEGDLEAASKQGEANLFIGRIIAFLQELSCFIQRAYAVTKNVIYQLAALYTSSIIDVSDVHFQIVYKYLGSLLTTLLTLDEIVENQIILREHWTQYKRMLASVYHNPSKLGLKVEKLKPFKKLLSKLESQIFEGGIFMGCVEQNFEDAKILAKTVFADEFALNIKNQLNAIEVESTELDAVSRQRIPDICCLFVLHFHLFRSVDKKFFKILWDCNKKIPAVPLYGNLLWFPDVFLLTRLPAMSKNLDRKAQETVKVSRQTYLHQKTNNLAKDALSFYIQAMSWMIEMDSCSVHSGKLLDDLNKKSSLLVQGLKLAWHINHLVKIVMNLHVALAKPMTKTSVLALCKMIQMVKAIEGTYHRHSITICESISHFVQHLSYLSLTIINIGKKRIISDKRYSERRLDVLSALVLAEKALNGPGTKERRLIAYLAMSLGVQMKSFKDDEAAGFASIMKDLDLICDFKQKIAEACDCSFIYWHTNTLLPVYIKDFYENRVGPHHLQLMISALEDCMKPLLATRHESPSQRLLEIFEADVLDIIKKNLLNPLCSDIETELRLHCHYHLQLDDRNPFKIGLKDFSHFLHISSIRLFDRFIDIKSYLEHYLQRIFYNLTTVALHDWKTYRQMRNLALYKYSLRTVEAHLPSQTLEQGLDVLEIMRNINVFVSNYMYNLNNQVFIERSSNNKHLNSINIGHIANSIRTHGIGIMNTTVNFTYQCLRKKFLTFSQFLYDDHIKSRLIKDIRYFKENKVVDGQKYPFDRADKFQKGIRKLGVSKDGLSYLDQFGILIRQIGNAMGFVRMIRSGGIHCCSSAIRFIPDLDDDINFEELCSCENLSDESIKAANKLDSVIGNLSKNFAEGSEYFKLLVDAFAPVFQDAKNSHLKNFFIIIPPLTLNFVEQSIASKEKLSRKNKIGAAFTDDGFAMGVAYILKLLNAYHEFDSLHWFQSVREKYGKEKKNVMEQRKTAAANEDKKLLETINLTNRRLDIYQQEFDLLNYSLSSARIFFRADLSTNEEKDQKKE